MDDAYLKRLESLSLPPAPAELHQNVPEILEQAVAPSELFKVKRLKLRFRNGEQRTYECLQGRVVGAVIVVAMLNEDEFILIREYAGGLHRYELGLPKGRLEPGEDIIAAANRELMEEAGFGARQLTEITELSLAPGYMAHRTHIVLARDLYVKKLPGDEPEAVEVYRWPLSHLHELAKRSDCSEGRTLAALYLIKDLIKE